MDFFDTMCLQYSSTSMNGGTSSYNIIKKKHPFWQNTSWWNKITICSIAYPLITWKSHLPPWIPSMYRSNPWYMCFFWDASREKKHMIIATKHISSPVHRNRHNRCMHILLSGEKHTFITRIICIKHTYIHFRKWLQEVSIWAVFIPLNPCMNLYIRGSYPNRINARILPKFPIMMTYFLRITRYRNSYTFFWVQKNTSYVPPECHTTFKKT